MVLAYWSLALMVRLSAAPAEGVAVAVVSVRLFSGPGFTTIWFVVAVVRAWVVSLAGMVKVPAGLICKPLKLAPPLLGGSEVVPAAKVPPLSATLIVSVDPVFPVVIVF